ncbi:cytochrome oxidase putative small subunit CydP [Massilia sp. TN1-12]|uniref:cytochrome oxidase putative small subunit CydP n=1 Tax=Massilia paldalensis TaxID=3377675 RepID=UPI0038508514
MTTASLSRPTRRTRRERLALTLFVTIAVKCLVLYGLWHAFFSHPQTKHMLLPSDQVERHLFTPAAGPISNSNK